MTTRKSHAERSLDREDAVYKQEFMLSGGLKPSSKTAADLPSEIERPKPNKTFMIVGLCIVIFLIGALIFSLRG